MIHGTMAAMYQHEWHTCLGPILAQLCESQSNRKGTSRNAWANLLSRPRTALIEMKRNVQDPLEVGLQSAGSRIAAGSALRCP